MREAHTLSLHGVTKRYGARAVVDGVSLEVAAGKFLTLLGPSGSGKTSILMMIAGFVEPSAGAIRLDGQDITALAPEKRNFGMVFQGYALFPHLTVEKNVAFPLAVRGRGGAERTEKVRAALELVQLGELARRLPRQLSGGQQQRVALARALVFSPDILLLDEPLSALDKQLRTDLQAELRHLHRRVGRTFICVTHDQEEALSMSDEVVVLRHGRLVQKGSPRELFEAPASHFVANFLGESNFLEGEVVAEEGGTYAFRAGGLVLRQLRRDAALGVGARLLLALRPAKIALGTAVPEAVANRIEGTVMDLTYRGDRLLVVVETALGRLKVEELSARVGALGIGERAWLSWSPDAGVIVADDRGEG